MVDDRRRTLLLVAAAVLYVGHVLLTVHQQRLDAFPSLDHLPDLSRPSGHRGPDYALPIARLLAMLGFVLVVVNVITSRARGHGSNLHVVPAVLMVVLGALLLLFGPMAWGFPWYGFRTQWASAWYRTTVLVDVLLIALAIASAWSRSTAPRRHDTLA